MLVPMHRLHGSVVRSEDSVYHQPLVAPDLMARTVAALDAGETAGAAQ